MQALVDAICRARRVYICGNGGSAANAIHIANDLIAAGVKAHALTADVATLTAIANDHGYHNIFARQLAVFGEKEDLLICLSGSGRSLNILKAIDEANRIGMEVFKIFGAERGENMQEAETAQIKLGHELARLLKAESA